mgnify:FL=1
MCTKTKPESAKGVSEPSALWSIRQTSKYLGVSDKTVRRWISSGKLAAVRAGRQIRIEPSAVTAYLVVA